MSDVHRFSNGLWVLPSRAMEYNAGAWISEGEAVLIDPGIFPDEIELLAKTAFEEGAILAALILSHSHWDHILGPEHLPGVKVIAQRNYPELTAGYDREIKGDVRRWENAQAVQRSGPFEIPKPDELIGETGGVTVGRLSLRLVHVPGHAADQLAIFERESGTLWASDILSDVEIPFVGDSLAAYERTLATLAEWDIRALVPGHGSMTKDRENIRARLEADRAYLAELRGRVETAVRGGLSVGETVAACSAILYRLPAKMAAYHRLNVESAYLEAGGAADPKLVGWNQDWEKGTLA